MRYNFLGFTYSFISQLIDLGFKAEAAWCYPPTIRLLSSYTSLGLEEPLGSLEKKLSAITA